MIFRVTTLLLCALGLYVSAFMLRKTMRLAREGGSEPSVVQSPRARVAGGVPNALLGLFYYAALALASLLWAVPGVWPLGVAAALGAAGFSAYLAYSLLFVTRMACVYCWTGHVVNWMLLALVLLSRP